VLERRVWPWRAENFRGSCILWIVRRDGDTVSAEMHQMEDSWLELRYLHNGEVVAWQRFERGPELFHEGHEQRMRLESAGWQRVGISPR
jgi:hypothetical protein